MKTELTDVSHKQVGIIIVNKGNFNFWGLYFFLNLFLILFKECWTEANLFL